MFCHPMHCQMVQWKSHFIVALYNGWPKMTKNDKKKRMRISLFNSRKPAFSLWIAPAWRNSGCKIWRLSCNSYPTICDLQSHCNFFSVIFGHFRSSIVKCYNEMAFSLYHHTMQGVTENGYSLTAQEWHTEIGPNFFNSCRTPKGS